MLGETLPELVWSFPSKSTYSLGRAFHGPIPVSGETYDKVQGPVVHTSFPENKAEGPLVHTNFP